MIDTSKFLEIKHSGFEYILSGFTIFCFEKSKSRICIKLALGQNPTMNSSLPLLILTGAEEQAVLHVATTCVSSKMLDSGLDILVFQLFLPINEIKLDVKFMNTPFVIICTDSFHFLRLC
jgi:hypothetical protein